MPDNISKPSKNKPSLRFSDTKGFSFKVLEGPVDGRPFTRIVEDVKPELRKFFSNRALFPPGSVTRATIQSIEQMESSLGVTDQDIIGVVVEQSVIESLGDGALAQPLNQESMELRVKFEDAVREVDRIESDPEYAALFAGQMAKRKIVLPTIGITGGSEDNSTENKLQEWLDQPETESNPVSAVTPKLEGFTSAQMEAYRLVAAAISRAHRANLTPEQAAHESKQGAKRSSAARARQTPEQRAARSEKEAERLRQKRALAKAPQP